MGYSAKRDRGFRSSFDKVRVLSSTNDIQAPSDRPHTLLSLILKTDTWHVGHSSIALPIQKGSSTSTI